MVNALLQLHVLGQSIWVDDIRRAWLQDGTLRSWIEADGIAGITSNPAIFEKAILQGSEYGEQIAALAARGLPALQIYETLAIEDVRNAADLFAPLYQASAGNDGFVSLEVSPLLADDPAATVHEARRLWNSLDRPNAMIKVPATAAGLPAIRELIAEGINVNVTLIFGLHRYGEVVEAFLSGLEARAARHMPLQDIASVASFFISRIDTAVDARLDALGTSAAGALRGTAALALAQLAHAECTKWTSGPRWQRLYDLGAKPQRLLWASTSAKDPAYDELKYVEALIAPGTVDTLPSATLDAYRKLGRPRVRLPADVDAAQAKVSALHSMGIDLEEVSGQLEREGVRKFVDPFERLLAAIGDRSH
jgi:transaldolase